MARTPHTLLASALLLAHANALAIPHSQTAPQTAPQNPSPSAAPRPAADDLAAAALVRNPAAPRDARDAAADSLIARADRADVRRVLEPLLGPADPGRAVLLDALGRTPAAPPELLPALTRALEQSADAELPRSLRALSSLRSRDAAGLLLRFTAASRPAPVRTAAFDALARLSGHTEFGPDATRWNSWFAGVADLTEAQWRAELVYGLARRADVLASDIRSASSRVVDSLRRLYMATPPAERSGLLMAMLADESPDARNLAFELASRELSASRRLDPAVGEVALGLLAHADPTVRANAAALVNRLNPPMAETRVLEALGRETESAPASAMILASTRWPSPAVIDAVFRWLDKRGPAFSAAADALWSLLRTGFLTHDHDLDRLLTALAATPDSQLTPSCCFILGSIGGPEGVDRLTLLLRSPSPTLRVAAGKALVTLPEAVDNILAAAAEEPQLLEIAAQSVMMHRPTGAAFRAVEALPAGSPEAHRRAVLSLAAQLPATDLLDVARESQNDMALRESYLTLLASPDRVLSERADPAKLAAIADGVVLLARTRLALDRPDGAMAALDALPDLSTLVDGPQVARLRALAMLCLNRLEDAAALDTTPAVWLDALERCVNKPFAPSLAIAIEDRFGPRLTPDEQARLARLRDLLPAQSVAPAAPADTDFVGPLRPDPEPKQ